jgi:transposase-like protein
MNLAEITRLTDGEAREFFERLRWPDGPACAHCRAKGVTRLGGAAAKRWLFQCNACRKEFSATVGTIFEGSHIPMRKWVIAIHLMCSSKKGVSALQLQRNLGLGSYKSAWHMAHRIRHMMKSNGVGKVLQGPVEVDETYVGGKTRKGIRGRGSERKTPVVALVSRAGEMRTRVVERVDAASLKGAIRDHVRKDATIYTDEWVSYGGIGAEFSGGHKVVKHKDGQYVNGDAHVNNAESWFALLKRGVHGIFHHVSREHLPRYCDEFEFRWNARKIDDGERTAKAIGQCAGKRLMYRASKTKSTATVLVNRDE